MPGRLRRGRVGAVANALVAGGLAVAVVAIAFGSQAPQLGVAEISPVANQVVEPPPTTAPDAPPASGSGRSHRPSTTTAPPATPPSTDQGNASSGPPTTRWARSRTCVGDPPRQIEDPTSPPCMATIFEGDNGGATARGVTATEVRVAIPHSGGCSVEFCQPVMSALFEFFNQRFEFYGRRLVPVFVAGSHSDPVASRALAASVTAQGVFGALTGYAEWNTTDQSLFQELGRDGIVSVAHGIGASDRVLLDELHPFLWTAQPSTEQWQRNMADFICSRLAGHPAGHAASAALRNQTRRFGIIAAGRATAPSAQPLLSALGDCGVDPTAVAWTQTGDPASTALRTAYERFRADGVTTITCVCAGPTAASVFSPTTSGWDAATWGPEVLLPQFTEPSDEWWQNYAYRAALFGPTARAKALPMQAKGWFQALQAIAPQITPDPSFNASGRAQSIYEQLLIMASGIQGAGPALTPDSFAAALMSTQFANAGAGQAPYWQPSVGFGPGDHSFANDYAIAWWSETAPAVDLRPSRPNGSLCYVAQGARYGAGSFPADTDARLFDTSAACR